MRTTTMLMTFWMLAGCGSGGNDDPEPVCGNDLLESGEECDKTRLGGTTCADLGFDRGDLACDDDCHFDTSGCENLPDPCGNGRIDEDEDCDGQELGGATCVSLGYAGGELGCSDDCSFDLSGCEPVPCGDGVVGPDEDCDGDDLDGWSCQALGFAGGELSCSDTCRLDASACSGCQDDEYEDNDDAAGATVLAAGAHHLVMCNPGGEEDWFSIGVDAGSELLVRLDQDGSIVDLDLEILDEEGQVLAAGGAALGEELVVVPVETAQTLRVRVFVWEDRPGAAGYTLRLVADPQCLEQADCAEGELCRDYSCVPFVCSENAPCPGGLVCDEGTCVGCITAADCPEQDAYVCQDHACVFSCDEDAYEPNSSSGEAADLAVGDTLAELTLCGELDQDWFRVDLEALHRYELILGFAAASGDVDAEIYEADDMDLPVAVGYGSRDGERLELATATDEAGSYLVRVWLAPGQLAQRYDLELSDLGTIGCAWDGDCAEEEVCLDDQCMVPACVEDADCPDPERCEQYACVPQPPGDTCQAPIVVDTSPFTAEDVDMAPYRDHVSFEPGSCTEWGTAGKDAIYQVALEAGQAVRAEVSADFDAALVLLAECTAPPAACLDGADRQPAGGTETVYHQAESAGPVYVVVDTFTPGDPRTGSFTLCVEVED